MSYRDGGDQPSNGQIKPQQYISKGGFSNPDNTIDQRAWKSPGLGQQPAPQANRIAPPDQDSDDYFFKVPSFGKTSVAGKAGVHHLDGEKTQYAFSLERGLHQRKEGTYQHEHAANANAEPLDSQTVADIARGTYASDRSDQENGNRHGATGITSVFTRGSAARLGQGKKAAGDNIPPDESPIC